MIIVPETSNTVASRKRTRSKPDCHFFLAVVCRQNSVKPWPASMLAYLLSIVYFGKHFGDIFIIMLQFPHTEPNCKYLMQNVYHFVSGSFVRIYIMIGDISWGNCTVYRAFVRFREKNARLGNFGCYLPCVTPSLIFYELISKYRQQIN